MYVTSGFIIIVLLAFIEGRGKNISKA
jgi:hypothetical protein